MLKNKKQKAGLGCGGARHPINVGKCKNCAPNRFYCVHGKTSGHLQPEYNSTCKIVHHHHRSCIACQPPKNVDSYIYDESNVDLYLRSIKKSLLAERPLRRAVQIQKEKLIDQLSAMGIECDTSVVPKRYSRSPERFERNEIARNEEGCLDQPIQRTIPSKDRRKEPEHTVHKLEEQPDIFLDFIISDLKNENRYLRKKLRKQKFIEKEHSRDSDELNDLKDRLSKSEAINKKLQSYIDHLNHISNQSTV